MRAASDRSGKAATWTVLELVGETHPRLGDYELIVAQTQLFPNFLKKGNLLAIVDRIVVIAVIAIGMTMVIITGGIELSVGSMVAFSAVIGTVFMKKMGGLEAGPMVVMQRSDCSPVCSSQSAALRLLSQPLAL